MNPAWKPRAQNQGMVREFQLGHSCSAFMMFKKSICPGRILNSKGKQSMRATGETPVKFEIGDRRNFKFSN